MICVPLPSIVKESCVILASEWDHGLSVIDDAAPHPWLRACVRYSRPDGTVVFPSVVKVLHLYLLFGMRLVMTTAKPAALVFISRASGRKQLRDTLPLIKLCGSIN